MHNPYVPEEGKVAEFWTMLEDLTMNGGPLEGVALGVSNYRPQDLEAVLKVARVKPVVNRECGMGARFEVRGLRGQTE